MGTMDNEELRVEAFSVNTASSDDSDAAFISSDGRPPSTTRAHEDSGTSSEKDHHMKAEDDASMPPQREIAHDEQQLRAMEQAAESANIQGHVEADRQVEERERQPQAEEEESNVKRRQEDSRLVEEAEERERLEELKNEEETGDANHSQADIGGVSIKNESDSESDLTHQYPGTGVEKSSAEESFATEYTNRPTEAPQESTTSTAAAERTSNHIVPDSQARASSLLPAPPEEDTVTQVPGDLIKANVSHEVSSDEKLRDREVADELAHSGDATESTSYRDSCGTVSEAPSLSSVQLPSITGTDITESNANVAPSIEVSGSPIVQANKASVELDDAIPTGDHVDRRDVSASLPHQGSIDKDSTHSNGGETKPCVSDLISRYTSHLSPKNAQAPTQISASNFKSEDVPKFGNIRARFEQSSKATEGNMLLFGEAFRQKQRLHQLADKEQKKVAQINIRGFDGIRGAYGEVDTSNLEKTYSFQNGEDDVFSNDGICRVDYQSQEYKGMVFVVHRTRGMLLLNHHTSLTEGDDENPKTTESTEIPGGTVTEEEYVAAAQQTGHPRMQLQLAARQRAAQSLFETTGIDMRQSLERLTPAVLQNNPQIDEKGMKQLKNEHENKLFYLLQVTDDDFVFSEIDAEVDHVESSMPSKLMPPAGEIDSPLRLKLSHTFSDFTFVKDPLAAAGKLTERGDESVTAALHMVMNQAVGPSGVDSSMATTHLRSDDINDVSQLLQLKEEDMWTGGITIVRDEEGERGKSVNERSRHESDPTNKRHLDTSAPTEVACCCGFW